jgi:hypothetical protein
VKGIRTSPQVKVQGQPGGAEDRIGKDIPPEWPGTPDPAGRDKHGSRQARSSELWQRRMQIVGVAIVEGHGDQAPTLARTEPICYLIEPYHACAMLQDLELFSEALA